MVILQRLGSKMPTGLPVACKQEMQREAAVWLWIEALRRTMKGLNLPWALSRALVNVFKYCFAYS